MKAIRESGGNKARCQRLELTIITLELGKIADPLDELDCSIRVPDCNGVFLTTLSGQIAVGDMSDWSERAWVTWST
jgi:hypothetical protein